MQAAVLGMLPNPLLTQDQLKQLKNDNIVSSQAEQDGRTLSGIGISPQSTAAIVPTYLWRHRVAGQFGRKSAA